MPRTLLVSPNAPGAYPTIGDAIVAAPDDALISLSPGEYAEQLYIADRRLTLFAGDGAGTVTLRPKNPGDPVVEAVGGAVGLHDLVMRSGDAATVSVRRGKLRVEGCELSARFGAAIDVGRDAEAKISKVKITGARYGIVFDESTGVAEECEISDIAEDGVIIRMGANPEIRTSTITRCGTRGIYVYQYGKPTIVGCDISHTNDAGIGVAQSSPTISRCWIHDTQGVGITIGRGSHGRIEECGTNNTATPAIEVEEGAETEIVEAEGRKANQPPSGVGAGAEDGKQELQVDPLLEKLDNMVGLAGVKAEVRALIDEIQVNEWRRNAGLSVGQASHHLIFAGAPGTGKTTVARIYGQLLAALGVLPGGPFKEVGQRDLVSQWVGHTAEKTTEAFNEAKGGVLFIDEAYTLSRQAGAVGANHGQEAIDALVKLMEDHRDEIAVIVAGYTDEMAKFLDANPGLASRFAKTIEFENYGPDDLVLIIERMAKNDDYNLTPEALAAVGEHFNRVERGVNFGNAREARKLIEGMRKAQAQRLRTLGRMPSADELRRLEVDDLLAAVS